MKIVFEINDKEQTGTLISDGAVDGKYIPLFIMNLLMIIAQNYKDNKSEFASFKNDMQKMFDIQLRDINNTVFSKNNIVSLSSMQDKDIN